MSNWIYLAFIMLTQLGGFIWWASGTSGRIHQLEKENDEFRKQVTSINDLRTEIAVIKVTLNTQTEILQEIKATIRERSGFITGN